MHCTVHRYYQIFCWISTQRNVQLSQPFSPLFNMKSFQVDIKVMAWKSFCLDAVIEQVRVGGRCCRRPNTLLQSQTVRLAVVCTRRKRIDRQCLRMPLKSTVVCHSFTWIYKSSFLGTHAPALQDQNSGEPYRDAEHNCDTAQITACNDTQHQRNLHSQTPTFPSHPP